jgi:hypothetical protein
MLSHDNDRHYWGGCFPHVAPLWLMHDIIRPLAQKGFKQATVSTLSFEQQLRTSTIPRFRNPVLFALHPHGLDLDPEAPKDDYRAVRSDEPRIRAWQCPVGACMAISGKHRVPASCTEADGLDLCVGR